jgi:hypothetical protein
MMFQMWLWQGSLDYSHKSGQLHAILRVGEVPRVLYSSDV